MVQTAVVAVAMLVAPATAWAIAQAVAAVVMPSPAVAEPAARRAFFASSAVASPVVAGAAVALVPLGPVAAELLEQAQVALHRCYGLRAQVLATQPLPRSAFYAPRRRYRAERLLLFLDGLAPAAAATRVVGLTAADISTTKGSIHDWGIFGLGWLPGRSAVVSTHRLRRRADRKLLAARLEKVVTHELGHTIGLDHCPQAGCLMQDARGTVHTVDAESGALCAECAARAAAELRRLGMVR